MPTTPTTSTRRLLATIDARVLNALRWGPLREMFPTFAEEVELGRYLKTLLAQSQCSAVEIVKRPGPSHVFDMFETFKAPATNQ